MAQERMAQEKMEKENTAQAGKQNSLEIEVCLAKLLEYAAPVELQEVELAEACGRVLGETVCAETAVPSYPRSAMDGYAVRAADLAGVTRECPVRLRVKGQLLAGEYEEFTAETGTTVRVMTGAYVPQGYDAVVRQEDTDYGETEVLVYAPVKPFQNYCKVGEDIPEGAEVVREGTRLLPVHIGLLAETGRAKVRVYRPLKVAILSTGTELTEAGKPLEKGKIYHNISYILTSAIRREGFYVSSAELCTDEEEILREKLENALASADLVITTGGVSVGKKDIVPAVLQGMGAEILFHGANIQPGTPTMGSVRDGKIILSLSGNPYAAIVNFEIYFWPLAAKMMCHESFDTVRTTAVLQSEYPKVNRMRRFLRARAEGRKVYLPTQVHASSVIYNLTECNCFIDLEPGETVAVGDEVRIRYIKSM